jgi:Spy/CpxP family protein refolding chaperone
MKKVFAVAAMLVTMAGAASAQGGGGGGGGGRAAMTPEQRLERTMGQLFKDITLTDAVKAKAETIIKTAMEAAAGVDRTAPEGMAKIQEINKKRNDDLKALLTSDDDKKKFDANAATGGRRGGF